jgi:RimJ/RimL family protein N-acetyltransferase
MHLRYWLSAEARGKGLAVHAAASLANWAIEELNIFRLELGHRTNNHASCRVATRAGLVPEGLERAKLQYGDERFDVETHARLATDPSPSRELLPVHTAPS